MYIEPDYSRFYKTDIRGYAEGDTVYYCDHCSWSCVSKHNTSGINQCWRCYQKGKLITYSNLTDEDIRGWLANQIEKEK